MGHFPGHAVHIPGRVPLQHRALLLHGTAPIPLRVENTNANYVPRVIPALS
jgi:hypothetical protein